MSSDTTDFWRRYNGAVFRPGTRTPKRTGPAAGQGQAFWWKAAGFYTKSSKSPPQLASGRAPTRLDCHWGCPGPARGCRRHCHPRRLSGDALCRAFWIVMHCIRKDRLRPVRSRPTIRSPAATEPLAMDRQRTDQPLPHDRSNRARRGLAAWWPPVARALAPAPGVSGPRFSRSVAKRLRVYSRLGTISPESKRTAVGAAAKPRTRSSSASHPSTTQTESGVRA